MDRPADTDSAPSVDRVRVLIVDDNSEAADMLARLVAVLGHEVRTAYSGKKALELVQIFWPQVMLLDLRLPDVGGLEVAKQIRAGQRDKRVLLAALTGLDTDEDRARCREVGFDDYFVKPLRLADLRRFVGRICH